MSNLFNPGFWLVALLLALGLFGAGYSSGNKHANTQCIANQVVAQEAAQTEVAATNTKREAVASNRELSRGSISATYTQLGKAAHQLEVERAASAVGAVSCGLDADGLRLWNAANRGATEAVRSEPNYSLSTAPAAVEWLDTRHVAEPYRIDGAIRPVPRSAGEPGGVLK